PPPLYAPEVVADAVLFACSHPKRTLYAGGFGLLSSILPRAAPRLADAIMEAIGTRVQQKPGDAGSPSRQDNLFEPRDDALRGSQRVHARRSSIALQLQKLPQPALAAGLLGAALTLGRLVSRGRHSGRQRITRMQIMSEVEKPENAAAGGTAGGEQPSAPSEDQRAGEMERVQKDAALEREEEGGYQ
ncbi:MAG TPA: hypothetical protein VF637_00035, partial [Sphingomicrobium sp.]